MEIKDQSYLTQKGSTRIVVIGGSNRYHGAPILAGKASLRSGSDYLYLITDTFPAKEAAMCSASLEFIVLNNRNSNETKEKYFNVTEEALRLYPSTIVVGPGLAENSLWGTTLALKMATKRRCPVVIDADSVTEIALAILKEKKIQNKKNIKDTCKLEEIFDTKDDKIIIKNIPAIILTPNIREFIRLAKVLDIDVSELGEASPGFGPEIFNEEKKITILQNIIEETIKRLTIKSVSKEYLPNVCIVQKNCYDCICSTNSNNTITTKFTRIRGAPRRCSGQGDILSGIIGTQVSRYFKSESNNLNAVCRTSCELMKECVDKTYKSHGISMIAEDILEYVSARDIESEENNNQL